MTLSKPQKTLALWIVLIIMFWAIYQIIATEPHPQRRLAFSELIRVVEEGRVRHLSATTEGSGPAARFQAELDDGTTFTTEGVLSEQLVRVLGEQGIHFDVRIHGGSHDGAWQTILTTWLPIMFLVAIFLFFMRQLKVGKGSNIDEIKKSPARIIPLKENSTRWSDVIGCEEAKQALQDIAQTISAPRAKSGSSADHPSRCLLVGPPGCGKTLLARALAGEAGVQFHAIAGAQFVEMFVGVGAARVRDLFAQAAKQAPAIIFIENLDAIARRRDAKTSLQGDERDQTLHQLLEALDGFASSTGVAGVGVVASSNRPDLLDEAIVRRGRFDRRVEVPRPGQEDRRALLAHFARPRTIAGDVDLEAIAGETEGLSAADLGSVVSDASRRAGGRAIERADLEAALAAFNKEERLFSRADA